jgi:hypothetical protein
MTTTVEIDEDLGIICAEFDSSEGFSPFAVGGGGSDSTLFFNDDDDNGPCFIATASLADNGSHIVSNSTGSYNLSGESMSRLSALRSFRDQVLMTNIAGRAFVNAYYATSPVLASAIKDSTIAKATVRGVVIVPAVGLSKLALGEKLSGTDMLGLAVLAAYAALAYFAMRLVYRKLRRRIVGIAA